MYIFNILENSEKKIQNEHMQFVEIYGQKNVGKKIHFGKFDLKFS